MKSYNWGLSNNDIGILFLAKSVSLTKPGGLICMVQSTNALLANLSGTAERLRNKIFIDFKKVESVINFAAFRTADVQLFKDVKIPTCVLTLRNVEPDGQAFVYECPKPLYTGEDTNRILIQEHDVHFIYPQDVEKEPSIWSTLMWGGERDRDLIRRTGRYVHLEQMKAQGLIHIRRGNTPGDRTKRQDELLGKRFVGIAEFEKADELFIETQQLAPIRDPSIDSGESTDLRAFQLPQLLIKTSWVQRTQRFQAKMVRANLTIGGVMCSKSIISIHTMQRDFLEACCACYNSIFATYYLFLTSRRFAFDRSEPRMAELQRLPIPKTSSDILEGITTLEDLDKRVFELFAFHEADVILIEDMLYYTLADFKGTGNRPGYQATHRRMQGTLTRQLEPELQSYCEILLRVLKAAYGQDAFIGAVIFSETAPPGLPMRMVAMYLNDPSMNAVHIEVLASRQLQHRVIELHKLSQDSDNPSVIATRHAV